MNHSILIIDDDDTIRYSCEQIFGKDGYSIVTAQRGEDGVTLYRKRPVDIVLLDLKLPGLDGMEVLKAIRLSDPQAIVIIMTAYGSVSSAVTAMRNGAYDYIEKPFTPDALRHVVRQGLEKKRYTLENLYLLNELENRDKFNALIGQSTVWKGVIDLIRMAAPTDATVLIAGESGTGKELVAREIHRLSPRRDKPFVTVDCGALVETLFESEVFGHIKGSFTGASATKFGRFELADGGTIFFDEIGNIGTSIQAKLLRAIQEKEIIKVGSTVPRLVDVRIIAATNKDLVRAVNEGSFSDALFYRLNVIPISLPPLRERRDDVPALIHHCIKKYSCLRKKPVECVSEAALKLLCEYDWPGNVRELENIIERGVILAKGKIVKAEDLIFFEKAGRLSSLQQSNGPMALDMLERDHIQRVLEITRWHKGRTATILGIDRKTLRLKIKGYGLIRPHYTKSL